MTDAQLASLSTIAWLVGMTATLILLARWSSGGTWGIASAIARGAGGWTARNAGARELPSDDDLGSIGRPRLDRLWAGEPAPAPSPPDELPMAEIEDRGTRRILP